MSYADAIHRVSDLRERLGMASRVTRLEPNNFDQVLATAHSRFTEGPAKLDTVSNEVASGEWPPTNLPSVSANRSRGARISGMTPELSRMIDRAAAKFDLPRELISAVAKAESGYRSDAGSPAGAQGLMQLMPATARGLGVTDILDPQQNLEGGAKYLKGQLDRFHGDVKLALAAYNAGPGNVAKYGGIPPFTETQNYVARVLKYAAEFGWRP